MKTTCSKQGLLATFSVLLASVSAHTWSEDIRIISGNGTFVGPVGYPRHFVPRDGKNGEKPDIAMVYDVAKEFSTNKNAPLCKFRNGDQNGFPLLSAAAGDQIALRYMENGHVSRDGPQGGPGKNLWKPLNGGIVFVYGTKDPKLDEKFSDVHRVWNTAGTGGDKRGRLLATRPYDDGECYEKNETPISQSRQKTSKLADGNVVCQSDVRLPTDAGVDGQYTFYWVWEWPLLNQAGDQIVKNETYTSCIDINLVANSKSAASAGSFQEGQASNTHGIKSQLEKQLLIDPAAVPNFQAAPSAQNPNPSPVDEPVQSQQPKKPTSSAPAQPTSSSLAQIPSASISTSPSSTAVRAPIISNTPGGPGNEVPGREQNTFKTVTLPATTITVTAPAPTNIGNGQKTIVVTTTEYLVIAPDTTMLVAPTAPASKKPSSPASAPYSQPIQSTAKKPATTQTGVTNGRPTDLSDPFKPSSTSVTVIPTSTGTLNVYVKKHFFKRFRPGKARRAHTSLHV